MRALVILVVLVGCSEYARTTTINAPGNIDLNTPMPNENGDPARFEPAVDPGSKQLVVIAMPSMMGGTGRLDKGAVEPGLEMRFELHETGKEWYATRLAFTAGVGFVQLYEQARDHFGALHAELNLRFPAIKGVIPLDIGVGPAFYADDAEFGGQISLRLPLLTLRARYMERNGFELWGGYEIPIPFIFSRSK